MVARDFSGNGRDCSLPKNNIFYFQKYLLQLFSPPNASLFTPLETLEILAMT